MTKPSECSFRNIVLDAAERLQASLVRYTSRFFEGDAGRAHDIVQHAFLQLCRCDTESPPRKVDQWLFRVCRNRAIDVQRREGRLVNRHGATAMDAVDERFPDASEKLSEQELFELVMQRMAVLPESQREAIELWSNGFCYSEIADVMERPQSSIRVLVHRAIARLRSDRQLAAAIGEDSGNPITVPAVGKF